MLIIAIVGGYDDWILCRIQSNVIVLDVLNSAFAARPCLDTNTVLTVSAGAIGNGYIANSCCSPVFTQATNGKAMLVVELE